MNKKGQGAIIAMAIGAILLVVILSVIFSTLSDQTTQTGVVDDTFTILNGSCARVTNDCIAPGSTTAIQNATDNVDLLTNFTECGASGDLFGYNIISPGTQVSVVGAEANATYTVRSCAFIATGTTRTLINLIPVLLAIAILIFIVGFAVLRR